MQTFPETPLHRAVLARDSDRKLHVEDIKTLGGGDGHAGAVCGSIMAHNRE